MSTCYREESKKKTLECELLSQEASRHALEEMKKKEEAWKLRTRMGEKAIQHHMVAIRRQMCEQKHRERYTFRQCVLQDSTLVSLSVTCRHDASIGSFLYMWQFP